jgi:hypothetical protein
MATCGRVRRETQTEIAVAVDVLQECGGDGTEAHALIGGLTNLICGPPGPHPPRLITRTRDRVIRPHDDGGSDTTAAGFPPDSAGTLARHRWTDR